MWARTCAWRVDLAGLGDDDEVVFGVEQQPQARADDGVVVGEHERIGPRWNLPAGRRCGSLLPPCCGPRADAAGRARPRPHDRAADDSWVYDFDEGSREMRALLGGKGANIAEMTRVLGPGAGAGRVHDHDRGVRRLPARRRHAPDGLEEAVDAALARLEAPRAGGSGTRPTRCSCPCAAARATRCRA